MVPVDAPARDEEEAANAMLLDPALLPLPFPRPFPELLAGQTLRTGGVSAPPFHTLNLGRVPGEDPAAVAANRARLARVLGVPQDRWARMHQVHSARVRLVDGPPAPPYPRVDGLVTLQADLLLTGLYADCLPVLLYAPDVGGIALLHAGWRGIVAGVVPAGVRALTDLGAREVYAAFGVGIGPCCYQVEERVAAPWRRAVPDGAGLSPDPEAPGRFRADLTAAARAQLIAAGVAPARIGPPPGLCTACDGARFFSHRRDRGRTGRMMAFLMRRGG